MKVLIVTNCATMAYVAYLRAMKPGWEVRGLMLLEALRVLAEGKEKALIRWMERADLYIGMKRDGLPEALGLRKGAELIILPGFHFSGHYPDSFHTKQDIPSPLGQGRTHSKIAAASFVLGIGVEAAKGLYNRETYDSLRYPEVFEAERKRFLRSFLDLGIDLSTSFDDWYRRGRFTYIIVHPASYVLWDILAKALESRGHLAPGDPAIRALREGAKDFLEPSIHWPVYPELGYPLGIEGSMEWKSVDAKASKTLSLQDFLQKSYEIYSAAGTLKPEDIPSFPLFEKTLRASPPSPPPSPPPRRSPG